MKSPVQILAPWTWTYFLFAIFKNNAKMRVMKLLYLEHIVETILSDVPCPKCGEGLSEDLLEIKNIQSKQIDIYIPCKNCGSQISIYADIEENIPETMFKILLPKLQKEGQNGETILSQKSIQEMSQSMKCFNKGDIRKLF